jgi:hypothetical protein
MSLDLIYLIYFYTDDYCTASNFWLISKKFNKLYMTKYNKPYKHKFRILYNNLFTFLSLLPKTITGDLEFFKIVTTQNLINKDKQMLKNDISFIYHLYKNYFTKESKNNQKEINLMMSSGPSYIDKIISVKFNKQKIKLIKTRYLAE